jgi:carbon-monoxide dehydrogenase small subunit
MSIGTAGIGRLVEGETVVRLVVNGEEQRGIAEPRTLLVDFLRHELGLTGTHVGCEQGVCGSCTVRLDGALVRACTLFAVQAEGSRIETVEGLAPGAELHPVQQAFQDEHGLQCGFCTPALVLSVVDFLERNPRPTEEEIREELSGSVCRCTGYVGIVAAVEAAARAMDGGS